MGFRRAEMVSAKVRGRSRPTHTRLRRSGVGARAAAGLQVDQWLADGLKFGLLLRIGRKVVLHLGPDLVTGLALKTGEEVVHPRMGEQVHRRSR